jgi:hypothetical protein
MKTYLFAWLPLLAACAGYDLSGKGDLESADTGADEERDDTGPPPDDTSAPLEPAWYSVRASLEILGGAASGQGAAVSIEVVDADLVRIDCVVTLTADSVRSDTPDTETGTLWWSMPVVPSDETPACAPLPSTLRLGVGPLHADARARLGAVSLDDVADSLYGAWIDTGPEPAAFGYAGTSLDLAGDGPADLPPPDGRYTLAPLYLLALPE